MHLAAGDQTLAVALATAGWALEERINHWHEITTVFHTGNTGDFYHFHITGFEDDDSHEWSFWRVKYCLFREKWLFTIRILKPLVGLLHLNGTQPLWFSPQSTPLWSRLTHRRGCYSSLCLEVWSGSRSTSHGPPDGCGPHTARFVVGGPLHTTYCTAVERRQRQAVYKDTKALQRQIRKHCNIPILWENVYFFLFIKEDLTVYAHLSSCKQEAACATTKF